MSAMARLLHSTAVLHPSAAALSFDTPASASSARLVASTASSPSAFFALARFPVASRSALDNARPICRSALSSAANLSRSVRFRTSSYGA